MLPALRQCLRMALALGLVSVFAACATPSPTPIPKPTDSSTKSTTVREKSKDDKCLEDRECASDKSDWYIDAHVRCEPLIAQYAKYDIRWGSGWGDKMWSRITIRAPGYKTLRYMGSNVEFQNVFGA